MDIKFGDVIDYWMKKHGNIFCFCDPLIGSYREVQEHFECLLKVYSQFDCSVSWYATSLEERWGEMAENRKVFDEKIKVLTEINEYLNLNPYNNIGSNSELHKKIDEILKGKK